MKGTRFITLLAVLLVFSPHGFTQQANQEAKLTGTLVVVNKSDNSVSIIDLISQKIINTLPTGTGPHELVISNDGRWAVSTDFVGGNSLTVFDLSNQTVARTIQLPNHPGPHGIKFLNDQQRVAFTSGKSQHMVIANIHTAAIETAVSTQQQTTHMLAIGAKEDLVYTTNIRSNSISQISLLENAVVKQISTEEMPEAINITADGKQLWYGANKAGLVTVIDTESEAELAQFSGFSFPYRVLFSHDEKMAIVPDFRRHEVRFFDTESLQEVGVLALGEGSGPQGVVLHPELDIVFLSLNLKNKIVAIDIASREIIAEYPTGNNPDGVGYVK